MTALVRVERLFARGQSLSRSCDGCTVCCTVMAVTELQKPSRRACDHVGYEGCRVHPTRPESCRAFYCLWIREVVEGDEALRPDALGVMFDGFVERSTGEARVIAFEVWPGALDGAEARRVIEALAASRPVELSYCDGRWSTVSVEADG